MSLFKRLLKRPSGGVRTLEGPTGSVTLVGREGDRYFERASLKRLSESTLHSVLARGVRGERAALDIGANVGLTSILIARAGPGPVYAFEPHPETFDYLQKTIAANVLGTVTAVNQALGRESGTLPFFVDEDSSASHVVGPDTDGREGSLSVPISTVDAFAAEIDTPIGFIKIDAEGAEPDVLAGARQTLERDRPGVFVEFNLFTLMALSNLNPRQFLTDLRSTFPYVYRFAHGRPYAIETGKDAVDYIHWMLTQNEINTDLYCTFDPL